MPAPSKWNRKAKARNDKRAAARSGGGRTASEAAFGRSQRAAGRAVSRTNTRVPKANRPRAVRTPLALPEVQTSIERLRDKYGSETLDRGNREARRVNTEVSQRRDSAERKLENTALRSLPTRGEALKAAPQVRASTQLNAEGTRVEKLAGATQVGNEGLGAVQRAAKRGQIRREGKKFTTPKVRRTRKKVQRAKRTVQKARAAAQSGVEGPLTQGQKEFVREFSRRTGINPRVAGAWVLAEMSGGAATGREADGNHNWLNIAYFDSGPGTITKDAVWGSPKSAAQASADFLKGERFGPSAGIRAILPNAKGRSDEAQIQAIAASDWASSGYDGGNLLRGTHDLISYTPPSPKAKRRLERAKTRAATVDKQAKGLGIQGVRPESPNKVPKAGEPRFVNFSKGGVGTSSTQWLTPTGGNEVLKFQKPLGDALIALAKASGEPVQVNSAYRSNEEQAALYQAYLNGTGNLAAPPGQSNHNHGAAVDVNLTPRQRELAAQFGLGFPVAGEDWHMELVGDAANQIVSDGGGGGGSVPTPSGGTSGSGTSGGSSAPVSREQRRKSVLRQLRELGFNVTPSGIRRTGRAASSTIEAPESVSKIKERYGVK